MCIKVGSAECRMKMSCPLYISIGIDAFNDKGSITPNRSMQQYIIHYLLPIDCVTQIASTEWMSQIIDSTHSFQFNVSHGNSKTSTGNT